MINALFLLPFIEELCEIYDYGKAKKALSCWVYNLFAMSRNGQANEITQLSRFIFLSHKKALSFRIQHYKRTM
ncbi:hypothetical protein AK966_10920 [Vibrio sp. PID23_8]|nr:hypothetical protein AK966_10920 [Vibrio sp. PID23_8]